MAAKRRELEVLEDLPDENAMRFGLYTLRLWPGTTFRQLDVDGVPCEWLITPGSEESPVVYMHLHGGRYCFATVYCCPG